MGGARGGGVREGQLPPSFLAAPGKILMVINCPLVTINLTNAKV